MYIQLAETYNLSIYC